MKKLLLVLLVVTLAFFLLVGCLPGTTPGEGEGEGEGEVAITFNKEYTNPGGVTFVPCGDRATVTFPTPVEVDYVVYVAVKNDDGGYQFVKAMGPNSDRTVWTLGGYTAIDCEETAKVYDNPFCVEECEPICIVALVKHLCCPGEAGEEVALRVVTVDCTKPVLDLFVTFTDCDDPCLTDDPCVEEFEGVSMEWTSRTSDDCDTLDCCEDDCSDVNGWSLVIHPDDPCEGPCDTVTGTGCPVEGVLECECFAYADSGETVCYEIDFSIKDNVGNAITSTWVVCLDTDEVVSFTRNGSLLTPAEGWYTVYNDCD